MPGGSYQIFVAGRFKRDARSLVKKDPGLEAEIEQLIAVLRVDPYNVSQRYSIAKLSDVRPGRGQWRIRSGRYRLRYDIFGKDVTLYSVRHRKDAY